MFSKNIIFHKNLVFTELNKVLEGTIQLYQQICLYLPYII